MPKSRNSTIKRCIILNSPQTPDEQAAFEHRAAKALAEALYRSLSPEGYDCMIQQLKENVRSDALRTSNELSVTGSVGQFQQCY